MIDLFKWFRRSKTYNIRITRYDYDANKLKFTPIWYNFIKYYNIHLKIASLNIDDISKYANDVVAIYRTHLTEHRGRIESFLSVHIEFDSEEDRVEFLLRFSDD
jgi:hypothetical protein